MKINNHVFAAVTVAILWGHTETLADAPRDLFRVDLRTARVVCCNTNDADSVMAAAELEKHLNMVAGERTPQADGFVFAVGEKPRMRRGGLERAVRGKDRELLCR